MTDPTGRRRLIAAYLAEHGPTWGEPLAEAVGLKPGQFWDAVSTCRWFELVVGGWGLTAEGMAVVGNAGNETK